MATAAPKIVAMIREEMQNSDLVDGDMETDMEDDDEGFGDEEEEENVESEMEVDGGFS